MTSQYYCFRHDPSGQCDAITLITYSLITERNMEEMLPRNPARINKETLKLKYRSDVSKAVYNCSESTVAHLEGYQLFFIILFFSFLPCGRSLAAKLSILCDRRSFSSGLHAMPAHTDAYPYAFWLASSRPTLSLLY